MPNTAPKRPPSICSVNDCHKPSHARGWCKTHHKRWMRHGDPLFRMKAANGELRRFYTEQVVPYAGDECLIWPYTRDRHGYAKMMVRGACKAVSRLVCEDANGPPPATNYDAAHSCGNGHRGCVAKTHLRWATRKENVEDMRRHGTMSVGESRHNAKITARDARRIADAPKAATNAALAGRYGISASQVRMIRAGRSWRWATGATYTGYG